MKVLVFDGGEVLPAGSAAVAVTVCEPGGRSAGTVTVKVPSGPTIAVPMTVPSTETVTVEPGSPVPVMVGVGSVVWLPFAGPTRTGEAGGLVSTVKVVGGLSSELPCTLEAETVATCAPSGSVVVGVQVKVPAPVATVVQTTWPSTRTVTVLPGSAVPV